MSNQIKPTPIALVVCDNIYQEPGGKSALVGIFNRIATASFPVEHPRMAVFASVTGLRKGSRAKLEIVHGETDKVALSVEGPFPEEANPLTVVDVHFVLNNVLFQEEGTYYINFWGNDHLLMTRPFELVRTKKQGS